MAIFWLITLVVLGTTVWVTYDAHTNQISMSSKQAYGWNSGALAWCIGCLLLWIVFFPAYLVRRSKTMAERSAARPATTMTAAIAGPTKLLPGGAVHGHGWREASRGRKALVLIVAAAVLVLIAVAVGSAVQMSQSLDQANTAYEAALHNLNAAPTITYDEFTAVQTGMSLGQVEAILGRPGTEAARSDGDGFSIVIYQWQNDDGSNMNVTFENGLVTSKAQFGLQ